MLLCPVCHEPLVDDERGAACAGGHRFDRAREGYLYLLRSSKSGDSMGDPKSQARSRRDFLNRGYYAPLRDAMVELVRERVSGRAASTNCPMTLLDICCGEGYYTSAMGAVPGVDAYGFDLGKETGAPCRQARRCDLLRGQHEGHPRGRWHLRYGDRALRSL